MSGSRSLLAALALIAVLVLAALMRQGGLRAPSAGPDQTAPQAFLVVTNPNAAPVDVAVSFSPVVGACDPRIPAWRDGRVLEPGAIGFFDTGPGGSSGLPSDCALSATVQASGGPVAALALSDWDGSGHPATLLAQPEAAASASSLLPAWTLPRSDADASRILARLLGDAPARLQLRLFDEQGQELRGCGEACSRRLSPGQTTLWRLETLPGLAPGQRGSAWIESEGRLLSVAFSRAGLDGSGYGPLLYPGSAGLGGGAAAAMLPELPKQALTAPVALRRVIGPGTAALMLQASAASAKRLQLSLFDADGQPASQAALGDLEAGRAVRLDLDDLTDLGQGAHAGVAGATDTLAALVALRWPQVKAGAAYAAVEPAQDAVLPIVWRGQPGRASWLTIQGGGALASVSLELFAAGGGEKPIASLQTRVAARGFVAIDLEDDQFASAGEGFTGWMRIRANGPVATLGFLADGTSGSPAIAAYSAAPTTALAEVLHAALIFSGLPDSRQPATPEPAATDEPLPPPRPSPTATDSIFDPSGGFTRPFDARGVGPEVQVLALGQGTDGTIWLRLRGRAGRERIVRIAPDGSTQAFDGLADLFERAAALARRAGSLPGLWSIDPAGRLWIGARYLEATGLRVLARDQAAPDGGMQLLDRVLLDRAGRAWVPRRAEVDCGRPGACAMTSLIAFDERGRLGLGIDLAPARPEGRGALRDAALLGSPGGGPSVVLDRLGAETNGGRPDSPAQGNPDAFVIDANALYALPDPRPIDYPGLGQPADPTQLRNAGYATAAGRDAFGRPVAFTWLEIQSRAGDRVVPELRMNTWVPASGDWLPPQALAGPGLPGSPLDPSLDQIRAAAWCPDGGLWLGTERGIVARWDGQAFGERLRPGLTPLPAAPVGALACTAANELLIATVDGLYRYVGGAIEPGFEITLPFLVQRRR
ncbi:MAG: hypothetical protein KDH92_07655 [Chloroflexi bacterium]|nr:hypothetical protein [Chloroflexota bacterium]